MTRLSWACVATVLLCAPATLAQRQTPLFTAAATGVRVDVLVTDGNVPVRGLTAADFALKDSGVSQEIDIVESSDLPINVVLAFDASGSTEGRRLADLVDASRALIAGLRPHDRLALTTFNHVVVPRVPLTADFSRVSSALERLKPSGQTAVFDGIHAAVMTTQAEAGRSLVIVCTDGRDTLSWLEADEVVEVARRANAVIYGVASGAARQWSALSGLTDVTGGHTIDIDKSTGFRAELVRLLDEFRSRYVLTYTPRGVPEGGFHPLEVKARRGLRVRARPGYVSGRARREP